MNQPLRDALNKNREFLKQYGATDEEIDNIKTLRQFKDLLERTNTALFQRIAKKDRDANEN